MGKLASTFYKRPALMISGKREIPLYGEVVLWMRCCRRFALLRSSVTLIDGSLSSDRRPKHDCVDQRFPESRSMNII